MDTEERIAKLERLVKMLLEFTTQQNRTNQLLAETIKAKERIAELKFEKLELLGITSPSSGEAAPISTKH